MNAFAFHDFALVVSLLVSISVSECILHGAMGETKAGPTQLAASHSD